MKIKTAIIHTNGEAVMRIDLKRDELNGLVNCTIIDKDVFVDETTPDIDLIELPNMQQYIINYLQNN